MSAIVGKKITRETRDEASAKLPKSVRPTSFFKLVSHPKRWRWNDDAGEFLPDMGYLLVSPGVGGVTQRGNTSQAEVGLGKKGFTVIQPDDPRLGEFRDYVTGLPTVFGRNHHVPAWESASIVGGEVFWKTDTAMERKFYAHIIAAGIIPKLDPDMRDRLIEKEKGLLERAEGRLASNPSNPHSQSRVTEIQRRIKAMSGKRPRRPTKRGSAVEVKAQRVAAPPAIEEGV